MKDFVTDLKRMNNMFKDEEDNESVGLLGEEVTEEASMTSVGDCKPSWLRRDRRVERYGGENAASRWRGDGR